MKYNTERLKGSITPIITPFDEKLAVDYDTLTKLVNWQIEQGAHGISVAGTTGEPSALSISERELIMETAAKAVAGRVPFTPGTGSANLDETLYLTKRAQALGADAVLVICPYYSRPNQQGIYDWYKTVADSVDIPVILYNIPARSLVNIEPKTMARLVKDCKNIIGVKEANKDFEHINHVIHTCGREFLVYSGIELLCYPVMAIGGAGHINVTANILPKESIALWDYWKAKKIDKLVDLHYNMLPVNEVLFVETNPGPVKAAMKMMGLIPCDRTRPPLSALTEASKEKIKQALVQYGLLKA
ncbi:4-hydroxy-tetrahydrodipicolinate synthase [Sporomusa aerivorans]|uniref:4-hydroxy-tetrahydrodipicolinate synthase n=1 Tax=Sporomusa aerivorans TaxID=204936 RepID=UPI003529F032